MARNKKPSQQRGSFNGKLFRIIAVERRDSESGHKPACPP
jgi:hypothetical protein